MRSPRFSLLAFAGLLLWSWTSAHAESPTDPLHLVSDQADLVIEVKNPRQLIESYLSLGQVQALMQLEPYRELYDSTRFRRFNQLIAYFEKELSGKWPQLLDRLSGCGVAVGVKFGPNPAPSLLVIRGKDEALIKKFRQLGLKIIEDELARQESKEHLEKGSYRDIDTIRIGKEFHAAVIGPTLILANAEDVLKSAIDLHRDPSKKSLANSSSVADARKLVGGDPMAFFWLNMETVRKAPQAKDVFTLPRNENLLTIAFGGWLDVAGRAPYLAGGLFQNGKEPGYVICMPRGREGSAEGISVHVPPTNARGPRPLLQPKGVIFSTSYYLDAGKFWDNRAKLFNEKNLKEFEEFDKNSGRFLLGTRFSTLINQIGPYQRFVAAHQAKPGYTINPKQNIPAFAVVAEVRDPEKFNKTVSPILRAAGFLASTAGGFNLKLIEEKHGPYTLVGYRFPEDAHIKNLDANFLHNYSPCFVAVGDQFIASSTLELAHELIDLVEKESLPTSSGSVAVQSRIFSEGGADYLQSLQDFLLTQTILDRGAAPESAREQVNALVDWVRKIGALQTQIFYNPQDFRVEGRLISSKKQ